VIGDAVRSELETLPEGLVRSALAETALELGRRLDSGPADREAVLLARELRLVLGELRRRVPEDNADDVEAFLARVANPDLGHPAD
jgi:hypothetical protein